MYLNVLIVATSLILSSCGGSDGGGGAPGKTPKPEVPKILSSVGEEYYSSSDQVSLNLSAPSGTDSVSIFLTEDCSGVPEIVESSDFSSIALSGLNQSNETQEIYALGLDSEGGETVACMKVASFIHDDVPPADFTKSTGFETDSDGSSLGGPDTSVSMPLSDLGVGEEAELIKVYSDASRTELLAEIPKEDFDSGSYDLDLTGLPDGNYTLHIAGSDLAGNETTLVSTDISVDVDVSSPVAPTSASITEGFQTSGNSASIDLTVDSSDVSEIKVLVNGVVVESGLSPFMDSLTVPSLPLEVGNNDIEVVLVDNIGNEETFSVGSINRLGDPSYSSLLIDNPSPYFELTPSLTFTIDPGADISFTATGANVSPMSGDANDLATGLTVTTPGYVESSEQVQIQVTDNANGEIRDFYYDIYAADITATANQEALDAALGATFLDELDITLDLNYAYTDASGGLVLDGAGPSTYNEAASFSLSPGANPISYIPQDIFGSILVVYSEIIDREFIATDFSVGGTHACYVGSLFKPACWGSNSSAQLGTGGTSTTEDKPIKMSKPPGSFDPVSLVKVEAGDNFSCGIDDTDSLYCWGNGRFGRLGDGSTIEHSNTDPYTPVPANGFDPNSVKDFSVGHQTVCAIQNSGKLYCWGNGKYGQLGHGVLENSGDPVPVNPGPDTTPLDVDNIKQVSVGLFHVCAIDASDKLFCWGEEFDGRLGFKAGSVDDINCGDDAGFTPCEDEPRAVISGSSFFDPDDVQYVSAGGLHTCAINNSNQIFCWGAGSMGQLGDGNNTASNTPVYINMLDFELNQASTIASGYEHTCSIDIGGKMLCWGSNQEGQLGDGTNFAKPFPSFPSTGEGLLQLDVVGISVSVSRGTTCASDSSGKLYCWGEGTSGQLGNGTSGLVDEPVLIDLSGI